MKIIDWIYKNSEESIIEVVIKDSNGNLFKGLLKLGDTNEKK